MLGDYKDYRVLTSKKKEQTAKMKKGFIHLAGCFLVLILLISEQFPLYFFHLHYIPGFAFCRGGIHQFQ